MKDKNGIEIDCSNCVGVDDCKDKSFLKYCRNRPFEFLPSTKAYESRIQELQELVSTLNQKLFNKRELRFTDEEIDFIKKAISMAILDCETNPPKPSEEQLKLMWSIKSKCDELLKEIKD